MCPNCGLTHTCVDCPTVAVPVPRCDPGAIAAVTTLGKLLGTDWADALPASHMVLLGRVGPRLARLAEDGFLRVKDGVVSAVKRVAIQLDQQWVSFTRPDSSMAVVDTPPAYPYDVAVDKDGNVYALCGAPHEDSFKVWNSVSRMWEVRPIAAFPVAVKWMLPSADVIELAGFTPLSADGPEDTQRTLTRLCGEGFVFQYELAAPGECRDCNGTEYPCKTSVATILPFPDGDPGTPSRVFGLTFSDRDGPGIVDLATVTGGTGAQGPPGKDGLNGRDGRDGQDGSAGRPGTPGEPGHDGIQGIPGDPGGPRGPKGDDGAKGEKGDRGLQGQRGEKGDPGKDGLDGSQGAQGEAGPPGANGSIGTPSDSDLRKIYVPLQQFESSTDIILASGLIASATPTITPIVLTSVSGLAFPDPLVGGVLVSVDAMLVQLEAESVDPEVDEAGTHNLVISLNSRKACDITFTMAASIVAANIFPRLDTIRVFNDLRIPHVGNATSGTMGITITNTKFASLPASSAIAKYNDAQSGHYKVVFKGWFVTRKVNPLATS